MSPSDRGEPPRKRRPGQDAECCGATVPCCGCCSPKCRIILTLVSTIVVLLGFFPAYSFIYGFGAYPDIPLEQRHNVTGANGFPFNATTAATLANYASVAYCHPTNTIADWTCDNCESRTKGANTTIVTSDHDGGVLAFIHVANSTGLGANGTEHGRTMSIVFRGTDTSHNLMIDGLTKHIPLVLGNVTEPTGAEVHEGFLHAYQSFRLNLRSTIRELQDKYPELHGENRGRITGHSLGGALATICAYDLAEHDVSGTGANWLQEIVTFGSPRVGDPLFAKAYGKALDAAKVSTWRVVHSNDVTPSTPGVHEGKPGQVNAHLPFEVWYDDGDDSYAVCDGSGEDPTCSASVPSISTSWVAHSTYMGITGIGYCPLSDWGTTTNMIQGLMWAWGAVGGVLLLLFAHNLVQYQTRPATPERATAEESAPLIVNLGRFEQAVVRLDNGL